MDLRAATRDDRPAIRGLLQDSGLPVGDLDTAVIEFLMVVDAATVVGVVGVERYDDTGLLRSLAVRSERRAHGIGARLVDALETHAASNGMRHLVLLTETAAPFFAPRGYVVIQRQHAPVAVHASAEFRLLCPASATCMIKALATVPWSASCSPVSGTPTAAG